MSSLTVNTVKAEKFERADGKGTPHFVVCDNSGIGNAMRTNMVIPLDFIERDTHLAYNTTTYTYTIPVAGVWLFTWACFTNTSGFGNGSARTQIQVNGSNILSVGNYTANTANITTHYCNMGDTVRMHTGTNFSAHYWAAIAHNRFTGALIG